MVRLPDYRKSSETLVTAVAKLICRFGGTISHFNSMWTLSTGQGFPISLPNLNGRQISKFVCKYICANLYLIHLCLHEIEKLRMVQRCSNFINLGLQPDLIIFVFSIYHIMVNRKYEYILLYLSYFYTFLTPTFWLSSFFTQLVQSVLLFNVVLIEIACRP